MPSKKNLKQDKIAEREARRFSKGNKFKNQDFKSKGKRNRYNDEE